MALLEQGLQNDVAEFQRDSIRFMFAGGKERLSPRLLDLVAKAERVTSAGSRGTVVACINYGGQEEIVAAVRRLAQAGEDLKKLNEAQLKSALTTAQVPACDLIIRTSGEQRLSNFLLWESAYAELYFTPVFFPDFDEAELDKALAWFSERQRRFGA